jgi:hypothetical protein
MFKVSILCPSSQLFYDIEKNTRARRYSGFPCTCGSRVERRALTSTVSVGPNRGFPFSASASKYIGSLHTCITNGHKLLLRHPQVSSRLRYLRKHCWLLSGSPHAADPVVDGFAYPNCTKWPNLVISYQTQRPVDIRQMVWQQKPR